MTGRCLCGGHLGWRVATWRRVARPAPLPLAESARVLRAPSLQTGGAAAMSEVVDGVPLPDIADLCSDDQLARAWTACLESGRILPILKEELKCRIQSRRLSEGKEELQVEFSKPKKLQPRPDEIAKLQRRREQNRRAAQKFREKNRDKADDLLEKTHRLELEQDRLQAEQRQLKLEKAALMMQLQQHMVVYHPEHHSSIANSHPNVHHSRLVSHLVNDSTHINTDLFHPDQASPEGHYTDQQHSTDQHNTEQQYSDYHFNSFDDLPDQMDLLH